MILVDDHLIAHRLAAGGLGPVRGESSTAVATTCSWWWRLSAALARTRGGALSRHFATAEPTAHSALQRTIARLPDVITILDLRELIPAMAVLSAEHDLNLLAAEAVVAAEVLDAELVVRQDTPKIREVATARGLRYRLDP
ncbi:MAG: hypothetical protein LC792_01430 [Actinobacteria bacterium]|nr:hypothetical protein [Actinomycetota bacterium]